MVSTKRLPARFKSGSLSYNNFPSSYRVNFQSGGSIDRSEIQGRLSKLYANVKDLTVTATIESVEQTGSKSAPATVRYSAQFTPFSYDSAGNVVKSKNQVLVRRRPFIKLSSETVLCRYPLEA